MNIAFPAFLILLLVLPGIIFRYAYLRGKWGSNSPFVIISITDEVAYGLFFAILLHTVWACVLFPLRWVFGVHIQLDSVLMLLIGNYGQDNGELSSAVASVTTYPIYVAGYFLGLYVISYILGYCLHCSVRNHGWDSKFQALHFRNEWYYLLSGEFLGDSVTNADGTYFTTVVEQKDAAYLYRGILLGYYFDQSGNFDKVVLGLAHRRTLNDDREIGEEHKREGGDKYYEIVGDLFVIRALEMRTINIEFFRLDTDDASQLDLPIT